MGGGHNFTSSTVKHFDQVSMIAELIMFFTRIFREPIVCPPDDYKTMITLIL